MAESTWFTTLSDFFPSELAERMSDSFPDASDNGWHVYDNPIERKLARNDFKEFPVYAEALNWLKSDATRDLIQRLTNISGIYVDPLCHGAGLHGMPPGGRLAMHVDYAKHPHTGEERIVNIIVNLNKEPWPLEAQLQLWKDISPESAASCTRIPLRFNEAAIFRCSDTAFHGLPDELPSDAPFRKTFAAYFVRPWVDGRQTPRPVAHFFPTTKEDDTYKELFVIRRRRRIEPEDLARYAPKWKSTMQR